MCRYVYNDLLMNIYIYIYHYTLVMGMEETWGVVFGNIGMDQKLITDLVALLPMTKEGYHSIEQEVES